MQTGCDSVPFEQLGWQVVPQVPQFWSVVVEVHVPPQHALLDPHGVLFGAGEPTQVPLEHWPFTTHVSPGSHWLPWLAAWQVPVPQVLHGPAQAELQHTPPTQCALQHSPSPPQAWPSALQAGWHCPPTQVSPCAQAL